MLRLKAVPRTGWLLRGLRTVESVADHSYGVAFLAMLLADVAQAHGHAVNVEHVLRMALLHDLTEARTGDWPATIKRFFDKTALHSAEEAMAAEMLKPLGELGASYLHVRHAYEARTSLEARLVKAADKLDLLLQARVYEAGGAQQLHEFWENAAADFAALELNEVLGGWLTALIDELGGQRSARQNSKTSEV